MGLLASRYEILETLTASDRGSLHKARDLQHDRLVAIKQLVLRDPSERRGILAETKMLLRLDPHPGLPVLRNDIVMDDHYVIVMDWVDGTDLAQVLEARGSPGLVRSSVVEYVTQVAAALDHLHRHDPPIVHGDVKPANLVLTATGKVVLVDFGIARLAGEGNDSGSRGFTAPEVSAGAPCGPEADVFGLAATTYALLTGRPPTPGQPEWDGIDPAEVAAISTVVRRGLTTDPARRYHSAGEFAERLHAGRRSLPRGVVTLLALEIDDAELWDLDPDRMRDVNDRIADLVSRAVDEADGWMHSSDGGSRALAAFPSATAALRTAISIRTQLGDRPWFRDAQLRVKLGLHSGEPDLRDGVYVGPVVARARRVQSRADGQQILLTAATAELVDDRLPRDTRLDELDASERGERVFVLLGPDTASVAGGATSGSPARPGPLHGAAPIQPSVAPSVKQPSVTPPSMGSPATVLEPSEARDRLTRARRELADVDRAVRTALTQQAEAQRWNQHALAARFEEQARGHGARLLGLRREIEQLEAVAPDPT
jgi:serine/threonine protein kinase